MIAIRRPPVKPHWESRISLPKPTGILARTTSPSASTPFTLIAPAIPALIGPPSGPLVAKFVRCGPDSSVSQRACIVGSRPAPAPIPPRPRRSSGPRTAHSLKFPGISFPFHCGFLSRKLCPFLCVSSRVHSIVGCTRLSEQQRSNGLAFGRVEPRNGYQYIILRLPLSFFP
jgi:hypothetical protein